MAECESNGVNALLRQRRLSCNSANTIGAKKLASGVGHVGKLARAAVGLRLFHDNGNPHRIGIDHLNERVRDVGVAGRMSLAALSH